MITSEIQEYNAEWERTRQAANRLAKRPEFILPAYLESELRIAQINHEQKLAIAELSFIGASPNKAIVLKDSPGNKIEAVWVTDKISVDIFEATINGTKIRYCSTGLIISPANPPEWVKDYVFGVNNPLEWYGEFKRTRREVLQIMEPFLALEGYSIVEAHKFIETKVFDFPKLYNEKDLV